MAVVTERLVYGSYSSIAGTYDDLFSDAMSTAESARVCAMAPIAGQILDIGCGTGLLLDHVDVNPQLYTGVDASPEMLERLHVKHPRFITRTVCAKFETFMARDRWRTRRYDSVISLFGSVNYISPKSLLMIPSVLTSGGKLLLMFYASGYVPVTYSRSGVTIKHFKTDLDLLSNLGMVKPSGDYIFVTRGFHE